MTEILPPPNRIDPQEKSVETLIPGDVVTFRDITELPSFEDILVATIAPDLDKEAWAVRPSIRELIRPDKFNGSIKNIRLTTMEDPYARLIDAPMRGWKSKKGKQLGAGSELSTEMEALIRPRYRGFILSADAQSTGRGSLGEIQAELWYFPTLLDKTPAGIAGQAETDVRRRTTERDLARGIYGSGVGRITTQPRIARGVVHELNATSQKIAFDVLKDAYAKMILTPMRS